MTRPSWSEYFHGLARHVATRATCPRKSVGCVIVRDNRVLSQGYNGSLAYQPHCTDVGCQMVDGHCIRTVHAEANAVAQAALHGVSLVDAIAYVTLKPCWTCEKLLRASGVMLISWEEDYGSTPTDSSQALTTDADFDATS